LGSLAAVLCRREYRVIVRSDETSHTCVPLFSPIGVISSMCWPGRQRREFGKARCAQKLKAKNSTMAHANAPVLFVLPTSLFPLWIAGWPAQLDASSSPP